MIPLMEHIEDISDSFMRTVLDRTKVIVLVGASANPARPSYRVMEFLLSRGYRVIPVNPGQAGKEILGQPVLESLEAVAAECGAEVQMLDIFRKSEAVPALVENALGLFPGLEAVWMQIGVISDEAAMMARAAGVDVVMDRCPKIEIERLAL